MTGNNRPPARSLDIEIELLPALLHALIIARTTHMMSGHRNAQKRMEELMRRVEEMMPSCLRAFDDTDVISIFDAAGHGPLHFALHHQPSEWRPTRFRLLVISDDGRHWISQTHAPRDEIEKIARETTQVLHGVVPGFPSGERHTQEEASEAEKHLRSAIGYDFTIRTSFLSFPEGETFLVHAFPPRVSREKRRTEDISALDFPELMRLHSQSVD